MPGDDRVSGFPSRPFRPHPLLKGGHLQTVIGAWFSGRARDSAADRQRIVDLPDGDRVVLHDELPDVWQPPDPVAVLIHGMCGCAASPYLVRIAAKLRTRGLRTFRLNLRGCGAGQGLAYYPYHAGRSEDLRVAIEFMNRLCPDSPIVVAGFSLGSNILLKWLGEDADRVPQAVHRAIAVNPPVDLQESTRTIGRAAGGLYDRYFAKLLYQQMTASPRWREDNPLIESGYRPRRIVEFDDLFTAPRSGFKNAADYYAKSSAAQFVSGIRLPTLILSSRDDPMIPTHMLLALERPECVTLHLTDSGGHLGYVSRLGQDPDRHWMDWRVVEWLTQDLGA